MRGLIPFGAELANKLFEEHPSAHTWAINMCMASLLDFYVLLGVSEWHAQAAADACRPMLRAIQGIEPRVHSERSHLVWKQKPKMHLFQELSECQSFVVGTQTLFELTKTKTLRDHRGDRCISWRAKKSATLALNVLSDIGAFAPIEHQWPLRRVDTQTSEQERARVSESESE